MLGCRSGRTAVQHTAGNQADDGPMSTRITIYKIPIGTQFHASPQSDYFGPCIIIGASGSAVHVEYQNGRRALLSLLPVERAHKGAIPAALLSEWRDEKAGASC